MSLPIHVYAYSGYKANERPWQFVLDEEIYKIALCSISGTTVSDLLQSSEHRRKDQKGTDAHGLPTDSHHWWNERRR